MLQYLVYEESVTVVCTFDCGSATAHLHFRNLVQCYHTTEQQQNVYDTWEYLYHEFHHLCVYHIMDCVSTCGCIMHQLFVGASIGGMHPYRMGFDISFLHTPTSGTCRLSRPIQYMLQAPANGFGLVSVAWCINSIPEPLSTGEVFKQGWLRKQGGGTSGVFARRNWRNRWFVLVGTTLKYYKDETHFLAAAQNKVSTADRACCKPKHQQLRARA